LRSSYLWRLLALNLRRNARHLLISSLGIVIGIGSFVFFISLGKGVQKVVANDLLGALPVNQIEIQPKSFAVGLIKLGGSNTINNSTIRRFRKLKEVKAVYPKMNLKAPSRAVIPIPQAFRARGMASAFYTELVIQGIAPEAIDKKDLGGKEFKYDPKKPVPILISKRLLELYNATLAGTQGLPQLTAELIRVISFEVTAGSSAFQRKNHPKGIKKFKCKVVGVSNRAILVGISVPLKLVQKLNRFYNGRRGGTTYQSAIIEAKSPEDIPMLLKKLDKMGFTLDSSQILARKVGEIILLITFLLTLISAIIMLISAIGISHAFFMFLYERRYQIGLMRAVGATRGTIRILVMLEAGIVGILSGIAGIGVTIGLTEGLKWGIEKYGRFPFSPDNLFVFPEWLFPLAIGFAIFFCLVGAFFPAQRAAAMDPAKVLNDK